MVKVLSAFYNRVTKDAHITFDESFDGIDTLERLRILDACIKALQEAKNG